MQLDECAQGRADRNLSSPFCGPFIYFPRGLTWDELWDSGNLQFQLSLLGWCLISLVTSQISYMVKRSQIGSLLFPRMVLWSVGVTWSVLSSPLYRELGILLQIAIWGWLGGAVHRGQSRHQWDLQPGTLSFNPLCLTCSDFVARMALNTWLGCLGLLGAKITGRC